MGRGENFAKTAKDRVRLAPSPLPKTRPRSLTAPLPEVHAEETHRPRPRTSIRSWTSAFLRGREVIQHTSDQSLSFLITRLPPEIRQRIWKEVLGGHWLHVVRAPKRLLAIKCTEEPFSSTNTQRHLCWGIDRLINLQPTPSFFAGYQHGSAARAACLLSLPMTCRLIYSETIDILYRDNVFDFNHLDTILSLSQTTLQSRLHQIRRVGLHWQFKYPMYPAFPAAPPGSPSSKWLIPPYDHETWQRACQILGNITSLQDVWFHLGGHSMLALAVNQLLDPLQHIKPAKSFDVTIPTTGALGNRRVDHLSCRFIGLDGSEVITQPGQLSTNRECSLSPEEFSS